MLEYKGYTGTVAFDDEAGIFHGEVLHLRDVITFQGTSVDEIRQAFRDSVDDYLAWCAESGDEPEKPFSGKFMVRLDRDLHRDVAVAASVSGQSLNSWVAKTLAEATRRQSDTSTDDANAPARGTVSVRSSLTVRIAGSSDILVPLNTHSKPALAGLDARARAHELNEASHV